MPCLDTSVQMEMNFDNLQLEYVVYKYSLNGTFLGTEEVRKQKMSIFRCKGGIMSFMYECVNRSILFLATAPVQHLTPTQEVALALPPSGQYLAARNT